MSRKRTWGYVKSRPKTKKPKVPESVKSELEEKAGHVIEKVLKPKMIKPPPKDDTFNYVTDLYFKWYSCYFYVCAEYCCPGDNAITPSFESKLARMAYQENGPFNLSYMRYTGEWVELFQNQSIDECLQTIQEEPYFI